MKLSIGPWRVEDQTEGYISVGGDIQALTGKDMTEKIEACFSGLVQAIFIVFAFAARIPFPVEKPYILS